MKSFSCFLQEMGKLQPHVDRGSFVLVKEEDGIRFYQANNSTIKVMSDGISLVTEGKNQYEKNITNNVKQEMFLYKYFGIEPKEEDQ